MNSKLTPEQRKLLQEVFGRSVRTNVEHALVDRISELERELSRVSYAASSFWIGEEDRKLIQDLIVAVATLPTGDTWSNAAHEAESRLAFRIFEILDILKRLKLGGPDGCWCGMAISNPIVRGHTVVCLDAQAIFSKMVNQADKSSPRID